MRALLKKLRGDIKGNVLLIAGAGTVALVGGAGLGVDTVQWYLWKRELQNAVDASALAGGQALSQGRSFSTAATNELNRNAENTTIAIVGMRNPPTSGTFAGDNRAVEVVATTQQNLPFSSLFVNFGPTLRSRAVATVQTDGEFCMRALAKTGVGVHIAGTANVNLRCGVAANSGDQYAFNFDGGAHLSGTPLSAVGGIDYSSTNVDPGTAIQSYGVEQVDPYAGIYSMSDVPAVHPANSKCDNNNLTVNPHDSVTLSPNASGQKRGFRFLCGGLTVRGTVTLDPGVYVLDGGDLTIGASGILRGDGVTIILTGNNSANVGTLKIAGGSTINLRAPNATDDPTFAATDWYGMLFFQDPIASTSTVTNANRIAGDATSTYDGIVYMPKANFTLTGSSGLGAECLRVVTYTIDITGEADIDNVCPTDITNVDLGARIVRLVE